MELESSISQFIKKAFLERIKDIFSGQIFFIFLFFKLGLKSDPGSFIYSYFIAQADESSECVGKTHRSRSIFVCDSNEKIIGEVVKNKNNSKIVREFFGNLSFTYSVACSFVYQFSILFHVHIQKRIPVFQS